MVCAGLLRTQVPEGRKYLCSRRRSTTARLVPNCVRAAHPPDLRRDCMEAVVRPRDRVDRRPRSQKLFVLPGEQHTGRAGGLAEQMLRRSFVVPDTREKV